MSANLDPSAYSTYILADDGAVHRLAHEQMPEAELAVIMLDGSENIVELTTLLTSHSATRFVFLAPAFPPSAALARVVASHGGAVLAADETPIVVAATLIAMLTTASNGNDG